jgi:DNA-binding NarL/FixJ family response regulator
LLKDSSPAEFLSQLGLVAAGKSAIASELAGTALTRLSKAGGERNAGLSPRERDVLRLVAEGCSNKEIGATLGICENTVKKHLSSLFEKLEVGNRTQLAIRAADRWLS